MIRLLRGPSDCLSTRSKDAESGIGQRDSVSGYLRELLADQCRFRDRVLAVHRPTAGKSAAPLASS